MCERPFVRANQYSDEEGSVCPKPVPAHRPAASSAALRTEGRKAMTSASGGVANAIRPPLDSTHSELSARHPNKAVAGLKMFAANQRRDPRATKLDRSRSNFAKSAVSKARWLHHDNHRRQTRASVKGLDDTTDGVTAIKRGPAHRARPLPGQEFRGDQGEVLGRRIAKNGVIQSHSVDKMKDFRTF
ncbi:MAG: hypothetical protein Ct9H300mP25_16310 [Acidobacteriota bacterium]|nr:MAG: hypothetical protein Ct9H300mP25_16310 [Acidobacteriota bacterium]